MPQQIIKTLPLILILLTVIGASLPMAWISLAKFTLLLYAATTLYFWSKYSNHWKESLELLAVRLCLLGIAVFGFSLLWTIVPLEYASLAWLKHSKLLVIPILLVLISDDSRARLALRWFIFSQGIVICLSWMIYFGVPISTGKDSNLGPIVFSESYIDQSLMFAISGAMAWHLRREDIWPRWLSFTMPCLAALNIILLLPGRTGHLILIAIFSITLFWELPRQFRFTTFFALLMFLISSSFVFSSKFRTGLEHTLTDSQNFLIHQETQTSSGWRLNAWKLSMEAMLAKPLIGYGVGSFVPAIENLQETNHKVFGSSLSSNPHQEFLLWGVELGVGGIILLTTILVSIAYQSLWMPTSTKRAMFCIVIAIFIACLFNSAIYDDLIGDFVCIAVGVCMAFGIRQKISILETNK